MLDSTRAVPLVDVDLGVQANVLIVDDNALNRKKMQMAVRKLGHKSEQASDGLQAIEMLRVGSFDAVLLDIVMPEMDGFDVLRVLKADSVLMNVPVIVVSTLDEQTDSVVMALELGAEDVLPKDFNPVLLKARLGASLTRKQYRDQELEYYRRVELLTQAAEVLESGRFDADSLELDQLAAQPDPLGRLAAILRGMAAEIYERELKLKRTVHILQGSLLVIAIGVMWGLTPSLSRLASGVGSNPWGLAIWVNMLAAIFCFGIAAARGKLPRLTLRECLFFLTWAIIAGVLQRLTTFWVAAHVEATMFSLIVTLQGFMVFGFAAFSGLEKASPRRLLGLSVGLVGVAIVLYSRFDIDNTSQNLWLLAAALLPVLFAIEAIVLAGKRPERIDIFASVALMFTFSTILLLPFAWFNGHLIPIGPSFGKMELYIVLITIASIASLTLAFYTISIAGSVFYSQSAYTMTLAGVVWGMLLLDEALPPIAWAAFVIILIGMYLVEPKPTNEKVLINRSFAEANRSS